jgi:anti-anti-sigma factor
VSDPDSDFAVHSRRIDAGWRLRVIGDLDIAAADAFGREVRRIAAVDQATVLVDLRRVAFIDVCGVRALLDACAVLGERGCEVAVLRGDQRWDTLLELTHAADWLPFSD